MKPLTIYFFLLAALVCSSCQKKYCFVCDTAIRQTQGMTTTSHIERNQVCNRTEKEIKQYEKENSGTTSQTVGSMTYTTSTVTTCSR